MALGTTLSDDESIRTGGGDERARNIVQGMGLLALQNLATSVLAFFFLIAIIRLLPVVQYGIYSAILVTVNIASSFATAGLNLAATRYVATLWNDDKQT